MKIKRLQVSTELFRNIFEQGSEHRAYRVISDGLPKDAVLCGVSLPDGRTIEFTYESSEFPEVTEDKLIPHLIPICETKKELPAITLDMLPTAPM